MSGSSSPCLPTAGSRRRGWTLIELLLAVVIALLVFTLLYAAYHTVLTATRGQTSRLQQDQFAQAAHQFGRELQAAFLPENDTNCVMRLNQDDGLEFEWCATLLGAGQQDQRWFDITRIRYRTVLSGTTISLQRVASPLVGPDALLPPVTNQVVRGLRRLQVELFDGETWQSSWPVTDPPELPEAARITLEAGRETTLTTEVFIMGGSTISPRRP